MFALFLLWQATKSSVRTILSSFIDLPDLQDPQASPPSAAQPADMDIRRLRRRFLEKVIDRKKYKKNKQKIKNKK